MKWAENIDDTLWTTHFKPVFDYLIGLAELIALTALFKVAADRTDSMLLDIFSNLLKYLVGMYAGLPLGFLAIKLNGVRTKRLWVALAIALPVGLLAGVASAWVSTEMSEAVENLGKVSIGGE